MDDTATVTTLSDRYRLDELIGSGGAGEVWLATDTTLQRVVAVKLLHPALQHDERTVERFRREAAAAGRLHHANGVVLYDVGRDQGRDYLVMEYVDGPALSEVLVHGRMQSDDVAALGVQVALGLAAAHDLGLIHRDIKPANILLSREGRAKVADFGIAKAVGESQSSLTATGTIVGSAAYVAPEQLRDDEIDGRTDLYALGLLLHECLTGQRPFGEGTPAEVAARRLHGEPEPPRAQREDVPPALNDVIVRATRREPDDRYPDATAMADALEQLAPSDASERLARLARSYAPRGAATTAVLPRDDEVDASAVTATLPLETDAAVVDDVPVDETREVHAAGPADEAATPARTAPDRPGVGASQDDDGRRVTAIAVAVLVAAVLAVAVIAGGGDEGAPDASGATDDAGPAHLPITDASDFDPFGGGTEHSDEVPLAHDGDPGTAWRTERYDRPYMGGSVPGGGLKSGTGLWFDLGDTLDVATVGVLLGQPGVDLEVYAGDSEPQGDPGDWGTRIHAVQDAPGQLTVEVPEGTNPRYVLVWITKVVDGRAAIAEVTFTPR